MKRSKIFPDLLSWRERYLLEDMGRRRLRRHKRQLQMIDNPVHNSLLRDESDDLHRPPARGADHRVNLVDLLNWQSLRLLICEL